MLHNLLVIVHGGSAVLLGRSGHFGIFIARRGQIVDLLDAFALLLRTGLHDLAMQGGILSPELFKGYVLDFHGDFFLLVVSYIFSHFPGGNCRFGVTDFGNVGVFLHALRDVRVHPAHGSHGPVGHGGHNRLGVQNGVHKAALMGFFGRHPRFSIHPAANGFLALAALAGVDGGTVRFGVAQALCARLKVFRLAPRAGFGVVDHVLATLGHGDVRTGQAGNQRRSAGAHALNGNLDFLHAAVHQHGTHGDCLVHITAGAVDADGQVLHALGLGVFQQLVKVRSADVVLSPFPPVVADFAVDHHIGALVGGVHLQVIPQAETLIIRHFAFPPR